VWLSNWTGSAWTRVLHEKLLYDGWNLLGAFNGTNAAITRSFLWGLDVSGAQAGPAKMQGAGGVGGLLFFTHHSTPQPSTHCAAYDGNGNLTALVDAAIGNTVANYEYGPFGEVIRASGTLSKLNPFRFSTKFQDDETDQLYYGYRFYNQSTGRWLNRDPRGETREIVLYAFVRNDSIGQIDPDGTISFRLIDAKSGKCGSFAVSWAFSLEQPLGSSGGLFFEDLLFVQKVTTQSCQNKCNPPTSCTPGKLDVYWEAWEMDMWGNPITPEGLQVSGDLFGISMGNPLADKDPQTGKLSWKKMTGEMKVFRKEVIFRNFSEEWDIEQGPPVNGLYYTTDPSKAWFWNSVTPVEGPATHSVLAEFDCCCAPKDRPNSILTIEP